MEKKLKRARFALMTMFEVLEKDIIQMKSRKQKKVHARMFYNYYLWKVFKVPHVDIKNYIDLEQPNTSFDLGKKIQSIYAEKTNDVIIEFDGKDFLIKHMNIISQLSDIFASDRGFEPGEFELDIFKITIINTKTYEEELIKCER